MIDKGLLKELMIFSDLSDDRLETIARKSEINEYKRNDFIFHRDEPALNFYGIQEGEVELSLSFKEEISKKDINYEESIQTLVETVEKAIVVDTIGVDEVFGWTSLLRDPVGWSSTAICSEHSKIITIKGKDLKALFSADCELGYLIQGRIGEIFAQRLAHRTDKLVEAWAAAFNVDKI